MKYFITRLMQAVVTDRKTRALLLKATSDHEYEEVVIAFAREKGYYVRGVCEGRKE